MWPVTPCIGHCALTNPKENSEIATSGLGEAIVPAICVIVVGLPMWGDHTELTRKIKEAVWLVPFDRILGVILNHVLHP